MSASASASMSAKPWDVDPLALWGRYQDLRCDCPTIGLTLDLSRMGLTPAEVAAYEPKLQAAYQAMQDLERGSVANPDEKRMVGHYWLRAPELAPTLELKSEISQTLGAIERFVAAVHQGTITPQNGGRFTHVLSIGIGGSALGPMFVSDALGDPKNDRMVMHFLDNTDPDGIERELQRLSNSVALSETLCLVISKSGSTPEPRNGLLLVAEAYQQQGLTFAKHAVAITGAGSQLDRQAVEENWLARFPMWDWVGGRTSETGPVGLVPAALQGLDIRGLLDGAAACDRLTRHTETSANPAALLAVAWHAATQGVGAKDMVVLPYKDRLLLFSRYLQQLIMESIGKRLDLAGRRVDQGISVYGNKGSTDQHAYVQQLRDGVNNFFVTFLRVLRSGGSPMEVEPGITAGDYLHGFLLGTREALYANERPSLTITIEEVNARSIGVLIALFERAVGLYAHLVGINAYHQPGVEAGKKAAAAVLDLQRQVVAHLKAAGEKTPTAGHTAAAVASALGVPEKVETLYWILEHLQANGIVKHVHGTKPSDWAFGWAG